MEDVPLPIVSFISSVLLRSDKIVEPITLAYCLQKNPTYVLTTNCKGVVVAPFPALRLYVIEHAIFAIPECFGEYCNLT